MNDVSEIADLMFVHTESLESMKIKLKERAHRKAKSIADYDKFLAITIIKIRNGKEVTFEGEVIKDPPVTLIEKLAKGICYSQRLEMETAEAEYKSLITAIETTKAELNGLQSINRHLDTI